MRNVLKSITAVLAGFLSAASVMMIIEALNGNVFYPELGRAAEGVNTKEEMLALMATVPVGAMLVVLLGWALGSLAGGAATARLAPRAPFAHVLVLGALLTLAGIANNLMIPPPLWFWVAGMLLFVPVTLLGARLAVAGSTAK